MSVVAACASAIVLGLAIMDAVILSNPFNINRYYGTYNSVSWNYARNNLKCILECRSLHGSFSLKHFCEHYLLVAHAYIDNYN